MLKNWITRRLNILSLRAQEADWRDRTAARLRLEQEEYDNDGEGDGDGDGDGDGERDDDGEGDTGGDNEASAEGEEDGENSGRGMRSRRIAAIRAGRTEEDEEAQLTEIQRQALVENLIGMGFPIEWALRAVENCEAPVSESTAISWIIERMAELEQSKEDMEAAGGDSSSRGADEEEFEDDAALESFMMQRHAASMAASNASLGYSGPGAPVGALENPFGNGSLLSQALGLNTLGNTGGRNEDGSGLSPLRAAGALGSHSSLGGLPNASSGNLGGRGLGGLGANILSPNKGPQAIAAGVVAGHLEGVGAGPSQAPWSAAEVAYAPALAGSYVARRRHDDNKQEVCTYLYYRCLSYYV